MPATKTTASLGVQKDTILDQLYAIETAIPNITSVNKELDEALKADLLRLVKSIGYQIRDYGFDFTSDVKSEYYPLTLKNPDALSEQLNALLVTLQELAETPDGTPKNHYRSLTTNLNNLGDALGYTVKESYIRKLRHKSFGSLLGGAGFAAAGIAAIITTTVLFCAAAFLTMGALAAVAGCVFLLIFVGMALVGPTRALRTRRDNLKPYTPLAEMTIDELKEYAVVSRNLDNLVTKAKATAEKRNGHFQTFCEDSARSKTAITAQINRDKNDKIEFINAELETTEKNIETLDGMIKEKIQYLEDTRAKYLKAIENLNIELKHRSYLSVTEETLTSCRFEMLKCGGYTRDPDIAPKITFHLNNKKELEEMKVERNRQLEKQTALTEKRNALQDKSYAERKFAKYQLRGDTEYHGKDKNRFEVRKQTLRDASGFRIDGVTLQHHTFFHFTAASKSVTRTLAAKYRDQDINSLTVLRNLDNAKTEHNPKRPIRKTMN